MKVVKWLCRCTSFISSLKLKLNFNLFERNKVVKSRSDLPEK